MADWKEWREMAENSYSAGLMLRENHLRSAVSRYYYAAYQIATAYLLYSGATPPDGREAWSHAETPDLLEEKLTNVISKKDQRVRLRETLKNLYRVRVDADYVSAVVFDFSVQKRAQKEAGFFLGTIVGIISEK